MEPLRKQVITMQKKINDLLDKPSAGAATRLRSEVQGLEDDLQMSRNPLSIEARIKRIIAILEGPAEEARIMNYEHLAMLIKWFEGLRDHVRRLK